MCEVGPGGVKIYIYICTYSYILHTYVRTYDVHRPELVPDTTTSSQCRIKKLRLLRNPVLHARYPSVARDKSSKTRAITKVSPDACASQAAGPPAFGVGVRQNPEHSAAMHPLKNSNEKVPTNSGKSMSSLNDKTPDPSSYCPSLGGAPAGLFCCYAQ